MPTIDRSVSNEILFTQAIVVANGSTLPIYGTLERANNYFGSMLEGQRWNYSDQLTRVQALVSATRRIDRLNFIGEKADEDQDLQFPRGTDTVVPVDVEHATYELALVLLKGVDPDTEADNLNMKSQVYAGLRSEYDRSIAQPYIRAGIPSQTAWNLLLPYLDIRLEVMIRRDS